MIQLIHDLVVHSAQIMLLSRRSPSLQVPFDPFPMDLDEGQQETKTVSCFVLVISRLAEVRFSIIKCKFL